MSMTQSGGEEAAHVAAINEVLDASVEEIPTISAVGLCSSFISTRSFRKSRRLMAIRSARMAAMRDLAEQIHGLNVEGNTHSNRLNGSKRYIQRCCFWHNKGARTVRINPTGADTYEVVLEIDRETLSYLLKKARSVA